MIALDSRVRYDWSHLYLIVDCDMTMTTINNVTTDTMTVWTSMIIFYQYSYKLYNSKYITNKYEDHMASN